MILEGSKRGISLVECMNRGDGSSFALVWRGNCEDSTVYVKQTRV